MRSSSTTGSPSSVEPKSASSTLSASSRRSRSTSTVRAPIPPWHPRRQLVAEREYPLRSRHLLHRDEVRQPRRPQRRVDGLHRRAHRLVLRPGPSPAPRTPRRRRATSGARASSARAASPPGPSVRARAVCQAGNALPVTARALASAADARLTTTATATAATTASATRLIRIICSTQSGRRRRLPGAFPFVLLTTRTGKGAAVSSSCPHIC